MRAPILALILMLVSPLHTLAFAQRSPAPNAVDLKPILSRPPPVLSTPAPIAPLSSSPQAGQCRLACAQTYYFCLAGDAPDECPAAWTQCRVGCNLGSPAS